MNFSILGFPLLPEANVFVKKHVFVFNFFLILISQGTVPFKKCFRNKMIIVLKSSIYTELT
jgi:hypothetical protein